MIRKHVFFQIFYIFPIKKIEHEKSKKSNHAIESDQTDSSHYFTDHKILLLENLDI